MERRAVTIGDVVDLTSPENMIMIVSPSFIRQIYNRPSKVPDRYLGKEVVGIYSTEIYGVGAIEISYKED